MKSLALVRVILSTGVMLGAGINDVRAGGNGELLGGSINSTPFAVTRGKNRMEVFAQGTDYVLWHTRWEEGVGWGKDEELGGGLGSSSLGSDLSPFVVARGNDRMDVFSTASNGWLKHNWWDAGKGWGQWELLDGNLAQWNKDVHLTSAPFVVLRGSGRMDVFATASGKTLWHTWWDAGVGWGKGESLGGALGSGPCVVLRGNDRMDVFARASDNTLWHTWWDAGIGWGKGESLGGHLSSIEGSTPFVIARGQNRMDVFARASDDTLWHTWWDAGVGWGAGESLGDHLNSNPFVLQRGKGMEVFAGTAHGTAASSLWHVSWAPGAGWSKGESLGGSFYRDPYVVLRGPNRVDIFAKDARGPLWHNWIDF